MVTQVDAPAGRPAPDVRAGTPAPDTHRLPLAPGDPRARLTRRAPASAALAALYTLAALPLARITPGTLAPTLLCGAAAGAAVCSLALRRAPAPLVAPVSLAALTGYTLLAVRLAAGSAGIPGPLARLWWDAAANGVPRLLTALVPVPTQPDTVLLPVAVTWLSALAGAELLLRTGRGLAACAPAVALYAGTLAVVGPAAPERPAAAVRFAALATVVLLLCGRAGRRGTAALRPPRGARAPAGDATVTTGPPGDATVTAGPAERATVSARLRRRVAGLVGAGAPVAVLLAATALLAPPLAARVGTRPADPRAHVTPPSLDTLDANPLARLSGWALRPDLPLLRARVTAPAGTGEVRLRLAVLDRFDGVGWRLGGAYRPAGPALPPPPGPSAGDPATGRPPTGGPATGGPSGRPVVQRITVLGLTGRLLPAAADPARVTGVRVAYDPAHGTLIDPDGLAAGATYTVTSRIPHPDARRLPDAAVPSGAAVAPLLDTGPDPPPDLATLAGEATAGQAGPYARAVALESFLATHYRFVADAPSGHAYPNLRFFLLTDPLRGGGRGAAEQFAASFAVLARTLGLPSRVVVGLRVRPGSYTVPASAATAWPEVLFAGVGWVAFDPLPRPRTVPLPVPHDTRPPPPRPAASVSPTRPGPTPTPRPPARGSAAPTADRPVGTWRAATATATGLAAGYVLLVLRRHRRTRRRLAHGPPPRRVAAAWALVREATRRAGRPAPAHLAASEMAALAGSLIAKGTAAGRPDAGDPPLDALAEAANRALFAPGGVDDADAEAAGAAATAYVRRLRARLPRWRRLLWTLDPRARG